MADEGTAVDPRLYVALDTADLGRARALAQALSGTGAGLKLGKAFFTAHGPDGVGAVCASHPVFLDLKFHDIPNTVAGAIRAACRMHPRLVNVHASGGGAMMQAAARAAVEGAEDAGVPRPRVLAVTVLTSLDDADLNAVGQRPPVRDQVNRLAALAADSGLDGVVCSPREAGMLRAERGPDFRLVVPGIRPASVGMADQKRILTPGEAVAAGANTLVVGRPVTQAPDPRAAARAILDEMSAIS